MLARELFGFGAKKQKTKRRRIRRLGVVSFGSREIASEHRQNRGEQALEGNPSHNIGNFGQTSRQQEVHLLRDLGPFQIFDLASRAISSRS